MMGKLDWNFIVRQQMEGQKKHFGVDLNKGFVFFRLEQRDDPDSWKLFKRSFDNESLSVVDDAGYFPEMIGKSEGNGYGATKSPQRNLCLMEKEQLSKRKSVHVDQR